MYTQRCNQISLPKRCFVAFQTLDVQTKMWKMSAPSTKLKQSNTYNKYPRSRRSAVFNSGIHNKPVTMNSFKFIIYIALSTKKSLSLSGASMSWTHWMRSISLFILLQEMAVIMSRMAFVTMFNAIGIEKKIIRPRQCSPKKDN